MRRALACSFAALAVLATGCLQVLGDFELEPLPPGVTRCDLDEDCGGEQVCYGGNCSKACGVGNPCPEGSVCSGGSCSYPVGTPCKSNSCGGPGGQCARNDPGGRTLDPPYCTVRCGDSDDPRCPSGFACLTGECYKN